MRPADSVDDSADNIRPGATNQHDRRQRIARALRNAILAERAARAAIAKRRHAAAQRSRARSAAADYSRGRMPQRSVKLAVIRSTPPGVAESCSEHAVP